MTYSHLPYRNPNLPIDQRVADLLGRMTLHEKLAQMSIFPGNISPGDTARRLKPRLQTGDGFRPTCSSFQDSHPCVGACGNCQ
jgi:hypothetical protein